MRQPSVMRALLVEQDSAAVRRHPIPQDPAAGFEVVRAGRVTDALDALRREPFAVVLVDPSLPDARGLEALDALQVMAGGTPLVVWADDVDDSARRDAVAHGAATALDRGRTDGPTLLAALRGVVATARFEQAVRDALRGARNAGSDVTVLQLHLPHWPALAARFGDADLALLARAVSERVAAHLGPYDVLHDLGDGRIAVVATDCEHETEARELALHLVQALERPVDLDGQIVPLQARCGWALAPSAAPTADVAVTRSAPAPLSADAPDADGRGDVDRSSGVVRPLGAAPETPVVAGPGSRRGFARRLRAAIAAGELTLHYQPIMRLGDDTIPVVEALVRWKLPTDDGTTRFLPPSEFIPLAEETGAIEEIGAFALGDACRQLREWDDLGLQPVRVAVNLSARELCSPALPARVADALAESGLPADRLELELTESMFADPEATAKMLRRLRALGVRVAIDDFGTGYSSLGYLTRFAVDVIKVDGAFVRRAAEDHDAAEVVRAIVAIAHQLDLEVVAEGIETQEQLRFVQGEGVDLVQGYLFCEPLPADAAGAWLAWAAQVVARESPAAAASAEASASPADGTARHDARLPRRERLIRRGTIVAGAVLGAAAVWPVRMPAASACPPSGEGLVHCQLQHGWAPALTVFMAVVAAVYLTVDLARPTSAAVRRRREPEERARRPRRPQLPGASADPVLLAATWGVTAPPNTVAAVTGRPGPDGLSEAA
ncbi:EAL domain-containing response regulator [Paraconexibacter antarcticus]|uniref:EAL domain-containing response regulator n=1 Tax=Paraconexibacter antarcticus TaxID=2949664 RepID=A0ABY5DR35_9ACTN|nr:REC domain-containing phosphodiesterase [Paraconexibacter antarcticus]UTI63150.1 EAL domain-containing response regulator [Paraconexibacter antarcticus]